MCGALAYAKGVSLPSYVQCKKINLVSEWKTQSKCTAQDWFRPQVGSFLLERESESCTRLSQKNHKSLQCLSWRKEARSDLSEVFASNTLRPDFAGPVVLGVRNAPRHEAANLTSEPAWLQASSAVHMQTLHAAVKCLVCPGFT